MGESWTPLRSCEPRLEDGLRSVLALALEKPFEGPLKRYAGLKVVELGLGRRFSYVVAEGGFIGLAFSWSEEPIPSRLVLRDLRLVELVRYAWQHPVATSLALAAANAAMQAYVDENPSAVCFSCDLVEMLGVWRGCRAAVVGYVPGIAEKLSSKGCSVVLFEDNPVHRREAEESGFSSLPGNQLLSFTGRIDVIVATGSSLLDARVYVAAKNLKPKLFALVGPTSSFHPLAARELGVRVLGGSHIPKENRALVLKLVKAGYGFRGLKRFVRKWTVKVD